MHAIYTRRRMLALLGGAAFAGAAIFTGERSPLAIATTMTPEPASPEAGSPGDELLLQITVGGGFVPVEYNLTLLPIVSLYADGRVITPGPMIEIYPRPALQNLRQMVITEEGIARVMEEARTAGLFDGPAYYDGPPVSDMPDTTFTVVENGAPIVVAAYALGFDESMLPESADAEARAKLMAFQDFMLNLLGNLDSSQIASPDAAFEIEKIKVYAQEYDVANPPSDDPTFEQPEMAWPVATPIASLAPIDDEALADRRCGAFAGEDAATLVEALKSANQLTPWNSDGALYAIWVRPLLPHEPVDCS
ncbi:MAG: hypothetical protein IT336_03885 [Thermomicrobiales bacterium]|nr:hypothetical protein [Thermomicrobiales bacterium]